MAPVLRRLLAMWVMLALFCGPAAGDLRRNPWVDPQDNLAAEFDDPRASTFYAHSRESLEMDFDSGIEFWKEGNSALRLAIVDGPTELPSDFEKLEFGSSDLQVSSLLILFVPLEERSRHPGGWFGLYGGIGPGLSLTYAEPFEPIERQSMTIGVDVRFGLLWSF